MKVIDLLNKIVNDEEVPKKIKYEGGIWEYDSSVQDYMNEYGNEYLFANMFGMKTERALNNTIEIIEEPKKIEKIEMCTGGIMSFDSVENITTELKNKINELINEINNLKENKQWKYEVI